ncbi:MAG: thioesterase family protein [Acidobacteriota bacterium]
MSDQEKNGGAFRRASAVEPLGDLRFRASVPAGWEQGKGAFGGLVLGAMLRAMEASEPEPRRVRTLSGEVCAPVLAGEATIEVEILRRGGRATYLDARLRQRDNEIAARASAVLSTDRPAARARGLLRPPTELPPVEALPRLPVMPPLAPVFTSHYAFHAPGGVPFQGGDAPRSMGYVGEAAPPETLDAPDVVGLLDAWWPAFAVVEERPRPLATVQFTAEFPVDPTGLTGATLFGYRGRADAIGDGFSVEMRELWAGDQLVALNQQTFVVLK